VHPEVTRRFMFCPHPTFSAPAFLYTFSPTPPLNFAMIATCFVGFDLGLAASIRVEAFHEQKLEN
jgi:hypothetical protein